MEIPLAKVLIVDDDPHITNLITRFLTQKNYEVKSASDGKTGKEIFEYFRPDLVILDINLPDTLGYNLCEEMQNNNDVFILMLTSRTDVEDKKKGFLIGADDYLTKPFDLEELEFRVQAILRRRRVINSQAKTMIEKTNLVINPETRNVKFYDQDLVLTNLEFDLLYFLVSNHGKVWRRDDLVANVWQNEPLGDNRVVDVHVGQIRRKMEAIYKDYPYIVTIRGVGYKFQYPSHKE